MKEIKQAEDLLDDMWGLICNVRRGNLELEDEQWVKAFERIRTKYFNYMDNELSPKAPNE